MNNRTYCLSLIILLCLPSFVLANSSDGITTTRPPSQTLSREDAEFKLKLESIFREKMSRALPDTSFIIDLTVRPSQKLNLSVLGVSAEYSRSDESPLARVQKLSFYSDREFSNEFLSVVTGLPVNLIEAKILHLPNGFKPSSDTGERTLAVLNSWVPPFVVGMLLASLLAVAGIFLLNRKLKNNPGESGTSEKPKTAFDTAGDLRSHTEQTPPRTELPNPKRETEWSPDTVRAYFAECYWTSRDAEAAALVRAYPKPEIYTVLSYGREYLDFLRFVTPSHFEISTDSYYLFPQPEFLELSVADTPVESLHAASEFRMKASNIGSLQLIRSQLNSSHAGKFSSGGTKRKSTHRTLPNVLRVSFADIAEESAVLQSDLPEAVKAELPSLYVLTLLPETIRTEIFQSYTARELAEAWVGPAELLNELSLSVPARKRELLVELQARVTADRESRSFRALLKQALIHYARESKHEISRAA